MVKTNEQRLVTERAWEQQNIAREIIHTSKDSGDKGKTMELTKEVCEMGNHLKTWLLLIQVFYSYFYIDKGHTITPTLIPDTPLIL